MAIPNWQATITTEAGAVIPGAEITVVVESTGLPASIFSNREGTTAKSNPFFTGADGFAEFYAAPGEYRVTAEGPSGSRTWRWESLPGSASRMTNASGGTTLGTASTRDVTTSATDTTAGRVLKVGDGGALVGPTIISGDFNTLLTPGTYFLNSGQPNAPASLVGMLIVNSVSSGGSIGNQNNRVVQRFERYSDNRIYRRAYDGSAWSTWVELHHTGNLQLTTSATDTTAGRVRTVDLYASRYWDMIHYPALPIANHGTVSAADDYIIPLCKTNPVDNIAIVGRLINISNDNLGDTASGTRGGVTVFDITVDISNGSPLGRIAVSTTSPSRASLSNVRVVSFTKGGESWMGVQFTRSHVSITIGNSWYFTGLSNHHVSTKAADYFYFVAPGTVSDIVQQTNFASTGFSIGRPGDSIGANRSLHIAGNPGTTQQVTIDGNGFVKQASPIIRLYTDSIEEDGHDGAKLTKTKTGVYKISGTEGFAQEGWYIENYKDANGNIKTFVEYEYKNGIIEVRTYEPTGTGWKAEKGEPKDIDEGRYITLRLKKTPEEPDGTTETDS